MKYFAIVIGCLITFVARTPPLLASYTVPKSPPQLVVSMTDGSRLVGTTTLINFPLRTDALGTLTVPPDQLRLIKFRADHESATVTLVNGDKLQGSLGTVLLELQTIFGTVTIPLEKTTEIEVRQVGGKFVECEPLPFPENCDWPGPRGAPARIEDAEIILTGQPARSKGTFRLPLIIEYEFLLAGRDKSDGGLSLEVIPLGTPRDLQAEAALTLTLGYSSRAGKNSQLAASQRTELRNGRTVWGERPFQLEAGKWYRLRWELDRTGSHLTIDDARYDLNSVTVPFDEFQLEFLGWQPGNVWHVRNITVH